MSGGILIALILAGILLVCGSTFYPRPLFYLILAVLPTQFLFVPVQDFFISPADVLVITAGVGMTARLTMGFRGTLRAVFQHRYIVLMIMAFALGAWTGNSVARTLIRLPLAIVPAVLACELLRTRAQLAAATSAFVVSGFVDASYGVAHYLRRDWTNPGRFQGMSPVNFTAMLAMSCAVIALAKLAHTRKPWKFAIPGALIAIGASTWSLTGLIALAASGSLFVWWTLSRSNRRVLLLTASLALILAFSQVQFRNRLAERLAPQDFKDGTPRNTAQIRFLSWRAAIEAFTTHPVTGIGYYQFLEYSLTDPSIAIVSLGEGLYTHSTYIEILAEGGLIAFVPFLLHFIQYRKGLRTAFRLSVDGHDNAVSAALAALPVMAVAAATNDTLMHYSFWSICGIGLACLNLVSREARTYDRHESLSAPATLRSDRYADVEQVSG
jgi:O-antigen ligase